MQQYTASDEKYIQQDDNSLESGGILLGRENAGNTNLIIEFITEPMPGDKSSRRRFFRKDIRHIRFFEKYMKIVKEYIDISVNGILILKIFHVIHLLILKIGKNWERNERRKAVSCDCRDTRTRNLGI